MPVFYDADEARRMIEALLHFGFFESLQRRAERRAEHERDALSCLGWEAAA